MLLGRDEHNHVTGLNAGTDFRKAALGKTAKGFLLRANPVNPTKRASLCDRFASCCDVGEDSSLGVYSKPVGHEMISSKPVHGPFPVSQIAQRAREASRRLRTCERKHDL